MVLPSYNSYPLPPVTAGWFFPSGTIFPPPTTHVVLEWTCEPRLNQTHGVSPEYRNYLSDGLHDLAESWKNQIKTEERILPLGLPTPRIM